MDPIFSAGFTMPEAAPKPGGMFGGGGDWRSALMAAGSALMARRNPQASAMLSNMLQMKQHQAMAEQQYQRERHDKRDDFTFEQDYRASHAQPEMGEFERALMASGVQPNTPEWQQMMQRRRDNMLDPIVNTIQGPVLRSMVTGGMAPPTKPVGTLTPIDEGGAGSPAPRPFPY
jgi:hypothetical protein